MMKCNEMNIRNSFKGTTKPGRIIDLWHTTCKQHFDFSIDIIMIDRKDTDFRNVPGEFNTARPKKYKNQIKLEVIINNMSRVNPFVFTHEIAHWINLLNGFEGVILKDKRNSHEEMILNSLSHHPSVYLIQELIGIDTQKQIDLRTEININNYKKYNKEMKSTLLTDALTIVDDLINCSNKLKDELLTLFKSNYPKTYKKIEIILDIQKSYDLCIIEQNKKFLEKIIQELRISKQWDYLDTVNNLKKMQKGK